MRRFCIIAVIVGLQLAAHHSCARSEPKDADDGFHPQALGMEVPVLTMGSQLDEHVGRLVAIKGIVLDSKIPRIIGVQVAADDDVRDQMAYAVGILTKWTVTSDQLRTERLSGRGTANDGPGVKYVLYFDLAGRLAKARHVPKN